MFVQRLHQFATLKEIAEQIKEGFVNAAELKHFLGQICCEQYPRVDEFNKERGTLEETFRRIVRSPNAMVVEHGVI